MKEFYFSHKPMGWIIITLFLCIVKETENSYTCEPNKKSNQNTNKQRTL